MAHFTESVVEEAALAWLEALGWTLKSRLEISSGELAAERRDYPPDKQEKATRTVLEQAEVPSAEWAVA